MRLVLLPWAGQGANTVFGLMFVCESEQIQMEEITNVFKESLKKKKKKAPQNLFVLININA